MVHIFDHIALEFPEKEIFFRLGGHCVKTGLNDHDKLHLMQTSRRAFELCRPQGRWMKLKINSVSSDGVDTEKGFLQLGRVFMQKYDRAAFLWCGAATIGNKLTTARDELKLLADSAIYDAVGSECADRTMDTVFRLSSSELLRQGMALTPHRFSPGYGDMPLEMQRFLFNALDMAQMGVMVNEYNYLIPEKSVTAFAFINTLQGNIVS